MKKILMVLAVAAVLIVAVVTARKAPKGNSMWSQNQERKQLQELLGADTAPWLKDAEIIAWAPDPNRKAQAFFVVRSMTPEEFKVWSAAAKLIVSKDPSVPPGVWTLPQGVKPTRWPGNTEPEMPIIESSSAKQKATVWSRWANGFAYTVVYPVYQ